MTASADPAAPWTCPFCPLLCDGFQVETGLDGLRLKGSDCPVALSALSRFVTAASSPTLKGQPCGLDQALAAAARLLSASRQPLFGGLGTDVAGARALYALADASGAICDAARGAPLMQAVRALQDRGGFTLTLAELRTRADLVVSLTGDPTPRLPEFLARAGLPSGDERWCVLDDGGDPFGSIARLAALVEGRALAAAPPALLALSRRLLAARYAVLVYEPARLPAHGALFIEMLQRVVGTLNRSTRAAACPLGGGDGAATANQVFTWLSGLPLRSHKGPHGLEHEGLRFGAQALLDDGAVDLLLWLASFGSEAPAPATPLPRIVIGHQELADAGADVFIPVATPGIDHPGHLFRTDGVVLMPLHAARPQRLPSAAEVLQRLRSEVAA
jgi:formylmethanofuran dehydrogenase subunit B